MKRGALLGLAILACLASLSQGTTPAPRPIQKIRLEGMGHHVFIQEFKAQEPARVVVSGESGHTLALYVFDRHGNCVAWDEPTGGIPDDAAVLWVPPTQDIYYVEVRSGSSEAETVYVALR